MHVVTMAKTQTLEPVRTSPLVAPLHDLLGATFRLYRDTHLIHWNVRGPLFPQLHKMLDDQYREIWAAIDEIAERIRALGSTVDAKAFESTPLRLGNDDRAGVVHLARANREISRQFNALSATAEEHHDPATADLANSRIRAHDQYAWMLEATAAPWSI